MEEQSKILSIQDIFDQIEFLNLPKLSEKIDTIFSKLFGLLVLFLENDLTPQQRQIWFELCMNYGNEKTMSGLEIAEKIGASKISKGVYASIRVLESRNLIRIHQSHPRAFAIQANEKHSMTALLIDLCKHYGLVL